MSSNAGIKNQLIQALVKHLTVEESFCSAPAGIQKTLPYWTVCRNVMNYTTLHDASMSWLGEVVFFADIGEELWSGHGNS